MQKETLPVLTLEALRSVPLFSGLDDASAGRLRSLISVRDVPAGTLLFKVGDTGDAMFLIEAGRVRIYIHDGDGDDVTLAELAAGDFFGEMAIVDGKPRSAHAAVTEEARLAVLSRQDFLEFVRGNVDVALEMVSAISGRLRRTDELLRQRVSRNVNEEDEARLTWADHVADSLAEFGGSWKFITYSAIFLIVWILLNTWVMSGASFDPFPYELLGLMLGIIAGVQAPIIMMSQNRQAEKERLRADLDFQINLKNELALAEVLRRLDLLESERLPLLFAEQNALFADARRQNVETSDGKLPAT
jgi:CRP/FNR family transcriptional regulator, cyclic AMP receptor protein